MKKVFLAVYDRLKAVTALQFIDLDKGQIDNYETRPQAAFPCALIDFDTSADTITGNEQRVTGQMTVRVTFDYEGETAANTPALMLAESLQYFDVIDSVKAALHGFTSTDIELIEHVSTSKEARQDGLTVRRLTFEITYNETI